MLTTFLKRCVVLVLIVIVPCTVSARMSPDSEPVAPLPEDEVVWRVDVSRTNGVDPRNHPNWGAIVPLDYIGSRVTQAPDGSVYLLCSNYIESEASGLKHAILLVKYSRSGEREWHRELGGGDIALCVGSCIATDTAGNVYVAGVIDPDRQDRSLRRNAFVASFTPEGRPRWSHMEDRFVSGRNDRERGVAVYYGMAIEGESLYLTGVIYGAVDRRVTPNARHGDLLVSRFRLNGRKVWSRQYPGETASNGLTGMGIAVHDRRVYVAGFDVFNDGVGDGVEHSDGFVLCLGRDGDVGWGDSIGMVPNPALGGRDGIRGRGEGLLSVDTDGAGNVYVAGISDADLNGEPAPEGWVYPERPFIAKYSPEGRRQWLWQSKLLFDTSGKFALMQLHIDPQDRVWSVGVGTPNRQPADQLVVMCHDTDGGLVGVLHTEHETDHAGDALVFDEAEGRLLLAGHCFLPPEGADARDKPEATMPYSFLMSLPARGLGDADSLPAGP